MTPLILHMVTFGKTLMQFDAMVLNGKFKTK